jgi:hypothetical protein
MFWRVCPLLATPQPEAQGTARTFLLVREAVLEERGIRALRSNGAANRIRGLDSQSLIARFQRRSRALIIGFTAAVLIAVVVLEAPVSGGATTDR